MDPATLSMANADAAKKYARRDIAPQQFPRGPIVAGPAHVPILFSALTGQTFRAALTLFTKTPYIVLVFDNLQMQGSPEENAAGDYVIGSCAVVLNGTVVVKVRFSGAVSATVPAYGSIRSDPIALPYAMAAGDLFWVDTYITTGGTFLPTIRYPNNNFRGKREGYLAGDLTASNNSFTGSSNSAGFGPRVEGQPNVGADRTTVITGDSHNAGTGWGGFGAGLGNYSMVSWALQNANIGYINVARGGETLATWLDYAQSLHRRSRMLGAINVISDFGCNDFGNATPLATLKTMLLQHFSESAAMGLRHFQQTYTPRTNSTDGWQTLAGQSPFDSAPNASVRTALNQWLRAPASAGAGASALFDAAGNLSGVFDTGKLIEVNPDGSAITINPATGAISNGAGGLISVDTTSYGTGTATATTTTTITDTSKAWTVDQWADYAVVITAGTGVGQVVVITKNTTTQLSIATAWTTVPSIGATFKIVKVPTPDGVHFKSFWHKTMSAAIDTAALVAV